MAWFQRYTICFVVCTLSTLALTGVTARRWDRGARQLRKYIKTEEKRMLNKTMHYDPNFDCEAVPGITFEVQGLCYKLHKVDDKITCAEAETECGLQGGTLIQYATANVAKSLQEAAVESNVREVLLGMVYNDQCQLTVLPARATTKAGHGDQCDIFTVTEEPCAKMMLGQEVYYINAKCETTSAYSCLLLTSAKRKAVKKWQKMIVHNRHTVVKHKNPGNVNQAIGEDEKDVELCHGDVPCNGDEGTTAGQGGRKKRSAINPYTMALHHKGILCYKFVAGKRNHTDQDKAFIVETFNSMSTKCCVQFREFSPDDPGCKDHYIRIFNGGGCYSYVGKVVAGSARTLLSDEKNYLTATYQNMSLYNTDSGTCLTSSIITHESLHAVGFWHEHTRPDRDENVEIFLDNVLSRAEGNFKKRNNDDSLLNDGPYDINSVMHYEMDDFMDDAIGDCCTIVAVDQKYTVEDNSFFGHGEISNEDVNKCNRLYQNVCALRNDPNAVKAFIESWSSWCAWGSCTQQCGGGHRVRTRHCNRKDGCIGLGNDSEEESCCTHRCPTADEVNYRHMGNFRMAKQPSTEWNLHELVNPGDWTAAQLLAACGQAAVDADVSHFGMMGLECYLDNNTPLSGSYPYVTEHGLGEETMDGVYSAMDVYSVDGNDAVPLSQIKAYWGSWCGWSSCSQTCGNNGIQERHRTCLTPNGRPDAVCMGRSDTETRECGKQNCDYMCGDKLCLHGQCDEATETCSNCVKGFYGSSCSYDMEVCECCANGELGQEYPWCADVTIEMCCDKNATCIDRVGLQKQCFCNEGFYDIHFDGMTCEPDSCDHDDNCTSAVLTVCNQLSGRCQCRLGYSLDENLNCVDYDECRIGIDECDDNSVCRNTVGSFTCQCISGYQLLDSLCIDINECQLGIGACDENSYCVNTKGAYKCKCNNGYAASGPSCTDIDECQTNNGGCSVNATCTNLPGTFTCQCMVHYEGDGINCLLEKTDCSKIPEVVYSINLASSSQTTHSGDVIVHAAGGINGAFVEFPAKASGSVRINSDAYDPCIHEPHTCTNGFTVSIGFKPNQSQGLTNKRTGDREQILFSSGPEPRSWSTRSNSLGVMGYYNNDKLVVVVHVLRGDNTEGWEYVSSIPADLIDDNKSHMLTITWAANVGSRLYLDGNLRDDDQVGQASDVTGTSDQWHFGSHPNRNGNYFIGDISSVSMWDNAMNEESVHEAYKCSIQNVCALDLCHDDAFCSTDICVCEAGYEGDGFRCQRIQEVSQQNNLPNPWHAWLLSPESKNNLGEFTPANGQVKLLPDGRHDEDLLFVSGPHPGQRAIMCDGSQDALKADADFADTCIGVPDECSDGFTLIWDMRFDGSGMKAPVMRSNWIISSGAHAGSNTTGISVVVRGPDFRAEVQLTNWRLEATATSAPLIGNWKHIAITFDGDSTVEIFYDGQLVGTSTKLDISAPAKGNHALTFCRPNGCYAFMCRADIANVLFYGIRLTGQELQSIYRYGVYGTRL